jgi:hypothetical protein
MQASISSLLRNGLLLSTPSCGISRILNEKGSSPMCINMTFKETSNLVYGGHWESLISYLLEGRGVICKPLKDKLINCTLKDSLFSFISPPEKTSDVPHKDRTDFNIKVEALKSPYQSFSWNNKFQIFKKMDLRGIVITFYAFVSNLANCFNCLNPLYFSDVLVTTPNRLIYLLEQDPSAINLKK